MSENQNLLALIPAGASEDQKNQLVKYVEAVRKQNIACLGDGEVFFKRDGTGMVKSVAGNLMFKEKTGEIAMIKGKPMLTATSYYAQNKIASCTIITPDYLIIPDSERKVPNPFSIPDPESGCITKVWVKKGCLGRNPVGNWVYTSCTLLYDIKQYFIQDCYKKILKNAKAGKVGMRNMLKEDEVARFYPILGQMGIVLNFEDPDILQCIDNLIQKQQFAERNAQTICERIVMRKHPAFTSTVETTGADKNAVGKVKVVGWTNDISKEELLNISKKLEQGEAVEIDGQAITLNSDETLTEIPDEDYITSSNESDETSNNTEVYEEEEEEINELIEDKPSEAENVKATDVRVENSKTVGLTQKIIAGVSIIGKDKFDEILKKNFDKPYNELREKQLEMLLKLVNQEADKGVSM